MVATVIQQLDPLPTFNKARSMLCLEETSRFQQSSNSSASSIFVAPSLPTAQQSLSMPPHTYVPNHVNYSSNADGGNNRGRGKRKKGNNHVNYSSNAPSYSDRSCFVVDDTAARLLSMIPPQRSEMKEKSWRDIEMVLCEVVVVVDRGYFLEVVKVLLRFPQPIKGVISYIV